MGFFVLVVLIGGCAVGAAVALIRGLRAFLHDGEELHRTGQVEQFGMKQNRMMTQRVMFQGAAILLIALIGALAAKN